MPEIITNTMCLAIVFMWNEISSEIQKENFNLGTNIRLPEMENLRTNFVPSENNRVEYSKQNQLILKPKLKTKSVCFSVSNSNSTLITSTTGIESVSAEFEFLSFCYITDPSPVDVIIILDIKKWNINYIHFFM